MVALALLLVCGAGSKPSLDFSGTSVSLTVIEAGNAFSSPQFELRNTGSLAVRVDSIVASPPFPLTPPWTGSRIGRGETERLFSGFGVYNPTDVTPQQFTVTYFVDPSEVAARSAEVQAYYRAVLSKLDRELSELSSNGPDVSDLIARMNELRVRAQNRAAKLRGQRDDARAKVRALWDERDRALEELRAGLFCSRCKRPKSQIERETQRPFEEHLDDVNGEPIPADEETIRQTMEAYARKIAQAQQVEDDAESALRELDAEFESAWTALGREKRERENAWLEKIDKKRDEINGAKRQQREDLDLLERNAFKSSQTSVSRVPTVPTWYTTATLRRIPFAAGPAGSCGNGLRTAQFSCRLPIPTRHGGCKVACQNGFGTVECCLAPRQVHLLGRASRTCPRLECSLSMNGVPSCALPTGDSCTWADTRWPSLAHCPSLVETRYAPRDGSALFDAVELSNFVRELRLLQDQLEVRHRSDAQRRRADEASGLDLSCPHVCTHGAELMAASTALRSLSQLAAARARRTPTHPCAPALGLLSDSALAAADAQLLYAKPILEWQPPNATGGPYAEFSGTAFSNDPTGRLETDGFSLQRCLYEARLNDAGVP